jgi:hypothetical protein
MRRSSRLGPQLYLVGAAIVLPPLVRQYNCRTNFHDNCHTNIGTGVTFFEA